MAIDGPSVHSSPCVRHRCRSWPAVASGWNRSHCALIVETSLWSDCHDYLKVSTFVCLLRTSLTLQLLLTSHTSDTHTPCYNRCSHILQMYNGSRILVSHCCFKVSHLLTASPGITSAYPFARRRSYSGSDVHGQRVLWWSHIALAGRPNSQARMFWRNKGASGEEDGVVY